MKKTRRAVFLDRDGVINEPLVDSPYVTCPEEFKLLPGVSQAIQFLHEQDYLVIIITNQQGIGLGLYSENDLKLIHEKMTTFLKHEGTYLDDILHCPHRAEENCTCRKPKPGMLIEASQRHDIDLNKSIMIGDSPRDIQSGATAGCQTILVSKDQMSDAEIHPTLTIHELSEITTPILQILNS